MGYGNNRVGVHPESMAALLLTFESKTKLSLREMASVADLIAAHCRYDVWAYAAIKESPDVGEAKKWEILTIEDDCRSDIAAAIEAYHSLSQDQFTSVLDRATSLLNERRLSNP